MTIFELTLGSENIFAQLFNLKLGWDCMFKFFILLLKFDIRALV